MPSPVCSPSWPRTASTDGAAGRAELIEAGPRPALGTITTTFQETTMGLLDGRVAIITGASKGIGRALSLRFGREGARVVCAARSAELVKDTAALVQKAGGQAIAVVGDAAIEDDVRRLVAEGLRAFGKIDTLVN